jgi:hypothetical protein
MVTARKSMNLQILPEKNFVCINIDLLSNCRILQYLIVVQNKPQEKKKYYAESKQEIESTST